MTGDMIKLENVISLKYGKALPSDMRRKDGLYPAYGANGIKAMTNEVLVNRSAIVVGRKGSAGELVLTDGPFWPLDVTYFVDFDERKYDLKYLYLLLGTLNLTSLAKGVKPGLNRNDVYAIEVRDIPHLKEQERIVELLDDAFRKIDATTELLQLNSANALALFDSRLKAIFEASNINWKSSRLKEVTLKIGSGATPRGGKESYQTQGTPLVRSMNVYDKGFKYKNLAYINEEQAKKLNNVQLELDDVILNITGASVARCCIVPEDCISGRVNQHVSIIRTVKNNLFPQFLQLLLISKPYKDLLLGIGEGAGSTRQAITKKQIEEFAIRYPEGIEEQKKIVDELLDLQEKCINMDDLYKKKQEVMYELKQSLLNRAFSGVL